MVPSRRKVKVFTDSATAIANIKGKSNNLSFKQHLKKKNYNLLENTKKKRKKKKELKLELVKVKEHSNNKWNIRADKLAKEGSKIENIDRIVKETAQKTSVSLC